MMISNLFALDYDNFNSELEFVFAFVYDLTDSYS